MFNPVLTVEVVHRGALAAVLVCFVALCGGAAAGLHATATNVKADAELRCYWRYGRDQYLLEAATSAALIVALGIAGAQAFRAPPGTAVDPDPLIVPHTEEQQGISSPTRIGALVIGTVAILVLTLVRSTYQLAHNAETLLESSTLVQLTFLFATFSMGQVCSGTRFFTVYVVVAKSPLMPLYSENCLNALCHLDRQSLMCLNLEALSSTCCRGCGVVFASELVRCC